MATKKIGIWGFGVVGKSALEYFHSHGYHIGVMDKRNLAPEEITAITRAGAQLYSQDQQEQFFSQYDQILPSPGVDLRPHTQHKHKWVSELDLIQADRTEPIIAITGTLGKTTTTMLIGHVLRSVGKRVWVGGNIGCSQMSRTLDLLSDPQVYDYIVMEVSSFQLELAQTFAPTIAVWTNFYPNHLDRHGTAEEYFNAKAKIFARQKEFNISLKGWELPQVHNFPPVTYPENIACAWAVAQAIGITETQFRAALATFAREEHRLEPVGEINGVAIFNDSKSTVPEATLAAVRHVGGNIILFVGGVSKGVDRAPLFAQLARHVKKIICFGAEADKLGEYARAHNIPVEIFEKLEPAVACALTCAQPGDRILFSPAGASFDLFKDYQERGRVFKELIIQNNMWSSHEKSNSSCGADTAQRATNPRSER